MAVLTRRLLLAVPVGALVVSALLVGVEGDRAIEWADAVSPSTPGRSHYVDCSRPTDGDGSSASPWNSLKSVNRHGAFSAGDKILLRRSTTCTGRTTPTGSGMEGHPIVLGAYGAGAPPTLKGGGTPSHTGTVQLTDVQYWTVQDLHLTNASRSKETRSYRAGVLLVNTGRGRLAGLTIQRLHLDSVSSNLGGGPADSRDYGGIAALTFGHRGSGFDGLRITQNRIDHVGRTGIVVANLEQPRSFDSGLRIDHNIVRWTRGDSIVIRGVDGGRIDHNLSAHGAALWPCKQCGPISPSTAHAGIWPAVSRNIRIDRNEVYGEHKRGGDGEGFDIDASAENVTLEYNYVHDNEGGGLLLCGSKNATVRFNIFQNNAKSAIAFIGSIPAKNSAIYNNTLFSSRKTHANVVRTFNGRHGSGVRFFNNLVYSYGPGRYIWPTTVTSSSNTFVGSHGPGEPRGARTSHTNPGLVKPGTGSIGMHSLRGYQKRHGARPLTGSAIPRSVRRDFFGKRIDSSKPPRGVAG